jgi:hypothetical protein
MTKEWQLNNLSILFVGEPLRAKAGKMPALLYEIFIDKGGIYAVIPPARDRAFAIFSLLIDRDRKKEKITPKLLLLTISMGLNLLYQVTQDGII